MRNGLIHKTAVIGMIYEASETATPDDENLLSDLEQRINDMDAVPNVSETREAEWKEDGRRNMYCTYCGNIYPKNFLPRFDWCPSCGAWMHHPAAR